MIRAIRRFETLSWPGMGCASGGDFSRESFKTGIRKIVDLQQGQKAISDFALQTA
jgi:hypothetical protein